MTVSAHSQCNIWVSWCNLSVSHMQTHTSSYRLLLDPPPDPYLKSFSQKMIGGTVFSQQLQKTKVVLAAGQYIKNGEFFFFFLSFLLFLFPTVEIKSNCQVYWILGHTHWLQVMTVFCIQVEIKQMSKYPYQHSYL